MFKKHDWQYRLIAKSKYFDSKWYLKTYPDVAKAKINPIEHYMTYGWREGRNPGPTFNTNVYLTYNPDVAALKMNPLIHWERFGKFEGRYINTKNTALKSSAQFAKMPEPKFPSGATKYVYVSNNVKKRYKRLAVFASFFADGTIPSYVIYYLKELKKVCDGIVFVTDNPIFTTEIDKIKDLVIYAQCERHKEYDFGSYKRGYMWLSEHGILDKCDELLLCNDSCYGPLHPFKEVFNTMSKKDCDFWGLLSSTEIQYHLQSYFLNFKRDVFNSNVFFRFMQSIQQQDGVAQVVKQYETKMTKILNDAGFKSCAFIECLECENKYPYNIEKNLTRFPMWLYDHGFPLIKVKAIKNGNTYNYQSHYKTLDFLRSARPLLYKHINMNNNNRLLPTFSIIIPSFTEKTHCPRRCTVCWPKHIKILKLLLLMMVPRMKPKKKFNAYLVIILIQEK